MKKQLLSIGFAALIASASYAGGTAKNKAKKAAAFRELPSNAYVADAVAETAEDSAAEPFKPSVSVGSIMHMYTYAQQNGYSSPTLDASGEDWGNGFTLYRARVMLGGKLSKNGSFFFETDVMNTDGKTFIPKVLDAQYEHTFCNQFMVIAGLQLVSNNRNGLQGAAGLMANDFTYFQYPYNLGGENYLEGNVGRDLGVNVRGFLLNDKLEYRLGAFSGRRFSENSPWRYVGRLAYNFLDAEKDYYYSGTKLGNGKTIALAAGFDMQTSYQNFSTDLFIDLPAGPGSVTLNSAFQYITGGDDTEAEYTFATMIPSQTVQFLELGYYFKDLKLQPWIRYEGRNFDASEKQVGMDPSLYNDLSSKTVFGGGLNYWFNEYGTNLRLSYTTFTHGIMNEETAKIENKTFGQLWLQAQLFIF